MEKKKFVPVEIEIELIEDVVVTSGLDWGDEIV